MSNSIFQGMNVLVTGGSRGLGRSLGGALAALGARVVLVARGRGELDVAVAEVRAAGASSGGTAWGIVADVGAKDDAYRIAGEAAALAGDLDVLVHNASTLGPTPLPLLLDTACEDLAQVLEVNTVGPFRLTKAVVGPMVLRGRGLVVQISSDAANGAYPRWGAYGASKAASDLITRTLAAELAGTGVRFVVVDPGEMATRMHADAAPDADPATLADPRAVAARILELLAAPTDAPSGARVAVSIAPAATAPVVPAPAKVVA